MAVELFPHLGGSPLSDDVLQEVDEKLETAGQDHRRQIDAAIDQQQIHFSQLNRIVDDALLHFQRKHPRKNHDDTDEEEQNLKFGIAGKNPRQERTLVNGGFGISHGDLFLRTAVG